MKVIHLFLFFILLSLTASSCLRDSCEETHTYTYYKPVYVTPEEYKIPVNLEAPKTLQNPGKIYFYQNYILINEVREGLHVINNENQQQPVNVGFIPIPGNVDMAVMNDVLYVDAYTDLLAININNPLNPTLLQRKENVFNNFYFTDNQLGLLSHYEPTELTETLDCSDRFYGHSYILAEDGGVFFDQTTSGNVGSQANGSPQVGQAGSMARFTITKNHLYAVGDAELFALPIQSSGEVGEASQTPLPWGIETIYPFKSYLFLGANDGMHIVDIEDPLVPKLRSSFTHARACDPVVVDNDIAFVTLHTGENVCPGDRNELQVLDVANIDNPVLLHTFSMENPHGLGFYQDQLYICEGTNGLKIFNKSNLSDIGHQLQAQIKDIHAWDVIALQNKTILVVGEGGFYQYDCSQPNIPVLLSKIPVVQ